MKEFNELLERSKEINPIFDEVDLDDLLNRFGPEGLYDLAKEAMEVADKDISDAMNTEYYE